MTLLADAWLPKSLRRQAAEVSTRLAEALREPPPPETDDDRSPASPRWRGQSLSKGAAGVAVLHGMRARAGLGSREVVDAWLGAATREPLSAGRGAGLWYGAAAVAFSITQAAPGRHTRVMRELDLAVAKLVRSRLAAARVRMDAALRPALSEFDLVRGLTGLGAYLLHRDTGSPQLRQVLHYLVRLSEPVPACDDGGSSVPGWWTTDMPPGHRPDLLNGGHADLGMAHGIAGPLALLALAMRAGVTVDGHVDAINRIADWLDNWRQDGPAGQWWPERITLAEHTAGAVSRTGPGRPSWCYGTPGRARALQLAGIATGDHTRQARAEDTFAHCISDPAQLALLTNAAVCHGWAGLFASAWHSATDASSQTLAGHLPNLLEAMLDHIPALNPPAGQPGLIEGNAGIAASLHSAATGTGGWQTCLLIN